MIKTLLLVALLVTGTQDYVEVTVKSGDTLSKIASKYLSDPQAWKELLQYNELDNPNLIRPGMKLKVPIQMASETAKVEGEKPKGPSKSAWRVAGVQGTVEEVASGQRRRLSQGDAVEPGAQLETAEQSSASFLLPDKSRVRIEASTKIVVTKTEPVKEGWRTRIRNLGGFLRAKVSKMVGSSSFDVETPAAVAGVRGTEFSVAYDAVSGVSKMAVEEGKVVVEAEGKEVVLNPGEGTLAKKGSPPVAPIALLGPPEMRTVTLEDGSEALEWERPSGAVQCGFVIARDAAFENVVRETSSMSDMGGGGDLEPGDYHARAFCQDSNQLRGRLSDPLEFTID